MIPHPKLPSPPQKPQPPSAPIHKLFVLGISFTLLGKSPLIRLPGRLLPEGLRRRRPRVLENLKAVLEAGGASLGQVFKTTVFLKDMNDFAAMNAIYGKYFAPEGMVRACAFDGGSCPVT